MATVRRPGPPVPPRPQAILLKTRTVDAARTLSSIAASSNRSPASKVSVYATATAAGVGASSEDGRTVVYKSPSFNLQKRQEQREKRYSFNTADGLYASSVVIERGLAPPPLHAKPTVAAKKPKPTAPVPVTEEDKNNNSPPVIDNRTEIIIVASNNNEGPVPVNPPQPKPRTLISKAPGGFLRRSKTTLDNFTRSTITIATVSNGDTNNNSHGNNDLGGTHSRISNGFMSGKTFDIKSNLKSAAERLFSEIVSHSKDSKYQTKSLNPLPPLHRSNSSQSRDSLQAESDQNGNCTRLNVSPMKPRLEDPIPPEKKIVFQEMLISELAAMRKRSSSVDQLNTRSDYALRMEHELNEGEKSSDEKGFDEGSVFVTSPMDDKSMNDSGTGSALTLSLNENSFIKPKRVRQRCPSGCSTDSSPCGMERSRIRTSDWIEVGENGKEEVMTSCQISLEDSGMEDEERADDGSSGVGDSWDSVKEAKQEEERETRLRARRTISMADLPPLPKSLSSNQTYVEPNDEILKCENETETTDDSTSGEIDSTLGKQLAVLRKEMYGLRQLDISLLSQLWTLNDSIQNFRTMLDDQECYSPSPPQSPSPSPYDSISSDADDDLSPSIQTQIQHRPEPGVVASQPPSRTHSLSSTDASPKAVPQKPPPPAVMSDNPFMSAPLQNPITTQPIPRNLIPPTPTPRTPLKAAPPVSSPRHLQSRSLPPPPPTTRPPVERLSIRPSSHLIGGTNAKQPVPVQRMRIAPPPPPVQRRAVVPSSRSS